MWSKRVNLTGRGKLATWDTHTVITNTILFCRRDHLKSITQPGPHYILRLQTHTTCAVTVT